VEMAPAAHYCLGGLKIDESGRTNLPGLFAAGEATGNVHGANRLSGNALAETQVFGRRAAITACAYAGGESLPPGDYEAGVLEEHGRIRRWRGAKGNAIRPIDLKSRLQEVMDRFVGLERDAEGLSRGLDEIRRLRRETLPQISVAPMRRFCYEVQEAYEVAGMLTVAELVVLSALERKETRGHHFRLDYPETAAVPFHTSIRLSDGRHEVSRLPVARLQGNK